MHAMSIMGKEGDLRVEWDPEDKASVDKAKAIFDEHVKEKMLLAWETSDGMTGKKVSAFRPEAENIVLSVQLQGG